MDQQKKEPAKKPFNLQIWYILIAAFLFMSLSSYLFNPVGGNISYSELTGLHFGREIIPALTVKKLSRNAIEPSVYVKDN